MILIYPDKLAEIAKVKMILNYLKYPYTYDHKKNYNVVFNSSLAAKHEFKLKTNKFVINGKCNDVTKVNVDRLWGKITGRTLIVNPLDRKSYCIEKPDVQGENDGKIVKCPYHPKNGMIYQKIVDTRKDVETMQDIRVVIARNDIVMTILKPKKQMFRNLYEFEFVNKKDVFENWEISEILKFSNEIGLDFGELDVLRSNFDDKIYVVDVNNLAGYGYFRDRTKLIELSEIFKDKFL